MLRVSLWRGILKLSHYFQDSGIIRYLACAHTHERTGSAERKTSHITDIDLTLLADAPVHPNCWHFPFETSVLRL